LKAASHGAFVLQSVTAEQTTDIDPARFIFTVLSDATVLPSIFEHALEQYVSNGGNVLIALGLDASRRTRIPLWNGDLQQRPHLMDSSGTPATVGQVDFTYPALEQVQPGRDNGGWAVTKFFSAASVDSSRARIAARLSDGTPLLLEKQTGEGHVLLFTSGLENLTNDLRLHPVFVAFVDKASRYLSGSEQLSGSRMVDSFVQLRSSPQISDKVTSTEIIDPDGRRPLSLSESRTAQTFRLSRSGFYQIHFANGQSAEIGVNPDRRESDLASISPEMQSLWTGSNTGQQVAVKKALPGEKYQPKSLWWYVMLLALLVAVAETALSSRYLAVQREEI